MATPLDFKDRWTPPLTLDRALEITTAISERTFFHMGLWEDGKPLTSLEGVTLGQMLEAAALVSRENKKPSSEGGGKTIHVVPDERLIAATFALERYDEAGDQVITSMPTGAEGHRRLIAVFSRSPK